MAREEEMARGERPAAVVLGEAGQEVEVTIAVGCGVAPGRPGWVVLARGGSGREASAELERVGDPGRALATHREADEAFWADAPVLSGDWPAHWRRGLHYDLETLRMMVKEPAGIFRHRWDAMQVHAPRVVLAEAALDALALSRADPATAAETFLGTFADAPEANVPCVREDGSDTMVSADGTVCGTGPQWGLPFVVAEQLAARLAEPGTARAQAWLARLYPHLARYLDFWLEDRRDHEGWLVHACSWESGQDLSPRFGDQPLGGGHPTWHLRPVDLHAAAAHAAGVLARVAELAAPADVARWREVEADLTARTRRLWDGARFADHDGSGPTEIDDLMLLLPLALGQATPEQSLTLTPRVAAITAAGLTWPAPTWVAVLATQRLGRHEAAGDLVAALLERVYRRTDARRPTDGTLPGVACEFWPERGPCGGEAYGWGAFTVELLLAVVLGLRIDAEGVGLRPALPADLRAPGTVLAVDVTLGGRRHHVVLEPGTDAVAVRGLGEPATLPWGATLRRTWTDLTPRATPTRTHDESGDRTGPHRATPPQTRSTDEPERLTP